MRHALRVGVACSIALWFGTAQAATVAEVFNGDMLGTNPRYFESVAGIPRESNGNDHVFKVQGCTITATVEGNSVSKLRMELGDNCQADLSSFVSSYAPAPGKPLTVGAFVASSGSGLSYSADCLTLCGNAADPSVFAHWEGPHAVGFKEVMLEVVLASDTALAAASQWEGVMTKAKGEDYVTDTRFNCDPQFNEAAEKAFADVPVSAVTIGTGLSKPSC